MYLLATPLLQCRSSLCLYPGSGLLLSCFYIASLWLRRFLSVSRRRVVFAPSFLCVWSQKPWRSRQIIISTSRFFGRISLKIRRMVKICDDMDLFLRKSFWFSWVSSQFWVLCDYVVELCISWLLWMWGFYYGCQGYLCSVVLGYSESPFLEKGGYIPLSIWLLCFDYIWHNTDGAVCRRIHRSSTLPGVFHQALLLFFF